LVNPQPRHAFRDRGHRFFLSTTPARHFPPPWSVETALGR
jgi:hypothetical protein